MEWMKGGFWITTDNNCLDIKAIHDYLTKSSWAEGIDLQTVIESISHSLNFGLFDKNKKIGFARVVTDYCTFGYLCDVYILEAYQKIGLAGWLMKCCHSHPDMKRLRRIMLVTSTAPWLYEKCGYTAINRDSFVWHVIRPDIYKNMG
ncbi:GNAT family N-acetyltransferase [Halomonas binhaiensis]|uniref:GNAT family N-acetyltransferase n=2 Tax=Halomonas binhaiensis TaxID=2562282 RepID=A0A856QUM6_9GAMM|nr:GNAT family N-acetyltransferase [Halomonas binhaiensis]